MTLEELKNDPREFVNSADLAQIIGMDSYALSLTARNHPERLGFPCMVTGKKGTRVRFPRRAFIKFVEGERP